MNVAGIIAWITANWSDIVKAWLEVIGVASLIVKLTPTLKDDDVLKGVIRFVGKYVALNRSSGPNA